MHFLFKYLSISFLVMHFISCSSNRKENQQNSDVSESSETKTSEVNKEGENLYLKYCMACHQTDGSGVPGMYPPIKDSPIVNSGNKEDFINILLNGLKGPIEVHGKMYNQQMPSQSFLSDEDLSKIINYVSKSFQNKGPEVTPADIKALRKQ